MKSLYDTRAKQVLEVCRKKKRIQAHDVLFLFEECKSPKTLASLYLADLCKKGLLRRITIGLYSLPLPKKDEK